MPAGRATGIEEVDTQLERQATAWADSGDPHQRREYMGAVYSWLHAKEGMLRRGDRAMPFEDLCGDFIVHVFGEGTNRLPSVLPDRSLGAFYYRAFRNFVIDRYRSERRRRTVPLNDVDEDGQPEASPSCEVERSEVARYVRQVVRLLPSGMSRPLQLHLDGLETAEIADELAVREGAARMRLHRARLELKGCLNARPLIEVMFAS